MSQKPHEPSQASRDRVMIMVASGLSNNDVGAVLGISKPTLRRHYKQELDHGYASITGRLAARLIAQADGGNLRAIEFYLERRGGWVRRDNVELANADDRPLSISVTYRKPAKESDVPGAS